MNQLKTFAILTFALLTGITATAQTRDMMFDRLQVSLTGGSTGIGIDLAMPAGKYVRLRTGYEAMPRVSVGMNFGIQVGDDPATSASKFATLSRMLAEFTGHEVNDNIDVTGQPTFHNFKLLVDVFPFKKKEWHFTAGFYVGPKQMARAFNTTEDMPSLYSVKMYNTIYERIQTGYYYTHPFFGVADMDYDMLEMLEKKLGHYGRMGVHMGKYSHDVYYTEPEYYKEDGWGEDELYHEAGEIKHEAGELKAHKGDSYLMEPDENSMVKAYIKTNAFKPYLGFGYDKALPRIGGGYSGWSIAFDAGIWMWGGTPSIVTHDGTDLAKDLTGVPGKVGRYVKYVKTFKVYPVVALRLTRTIKFKKKNNPIITHIIQHTRHDYSSRF